MKLSESEVGDAVFDWLAGFRWSIAHGGGIAPGTPSAGAPTAVRSWWKSGRETRWSG